MIVVLARLWLVVAGTILLGWFGGLVLWRPPESGFGDVGFLYAPAVGVLPTLPALIGSGWFLASPSRWRHFGLVALICTAIGGAYLAAFSHFGGFCLDPEDVCTVTWPSRVAAICGAMLSVAAGAAVERWRRAGLSTQAPDETTSRRADDLESGVR